MRKENLPKDELLKMIDSFEHYPAATDADDRAYILAYLDDEACSISQNEIKDYLSAITITKDNIHLYYEFMSDEDIKIYSFTLETIFDERLSLINEHLNDDINDFVVLGEDAPKHEHYNSLIGIKIFGVEDTLKPIDEYIAEIKASNEYKEYVFKQKLEKMSKRDDLIFNMSINDNLISSINSQYHYTIESIIESLECLESEDIDILEIWKAGDTAMFESLFFKGSDIASIIKILSNLKSM